MHAFVAIAGLKLHTWIRLLLCLCEDTVHCCASLSMLRDLCRFLEAKLLNEYVAKMFGGSWLFQSSGLYLLMICRLLGAKLLYEYVAKRLGGGPVPEFWARLVGAGTGFFFASLFLDCKFMDCLPKTIVPWNSRAIASSALR